MTPDGARYRARLHACMHGAGLQVRQRLAAGGVDESSMTVSTFHAWGCHVLCAFHKVGLGELLLLPVLQRSRYAPALHYAVYPAPTWQAPTATASACCATHGPCVLRVMVLAACTQRMAACGPAWAARRRSWACVRRRMCGTSTTASWPSRTPSGAVRRHAGTRAMHAWHLERACAVARMRLQPTVQALLHAFPYMHRLSLMRMWRPTQCRCCMLHAAQRRAAAVSLLACLRAHSRLSRQHAFAPVPASTPGPGWPAVLAGWPT